MKCLLVEWIISDGANTAHDAKETIYKVDGLAYTPLYFRIINREEFTFVDTDQWAQPSFSWAELTKYSDVESKRWLTQEELFAIAL